MSILYRLRARFAGVALGLRKVAVSGSEPLKTRFNARRLRALLCDSEGSTLFETAISSIFMATLLLLIFSIAMGLIAYQQLGYSVMRTTQTLAYGRGILTDPCKTAASLIAANLTTWTPNNFTYQIDITTTVNSVDSVATYGPYTGQSAATCTAGATSLTNATAGANGNPLILHVTYTYNWFPIFGEHLTGTLASEDTMLVE